MKGGRKKRQQGGEKEQQLWAQRGKERRGKERARERVEKKETEEQGGTTLWKPGMRLRGPETHSSSRSRCCLEASNSSDVPLSFSPPFLFCSSMHLAALRLGEHVGVSEFL